MTKMGAKKGKTKGLSYWKKKAWSNFSKYIRLRDAIETTGTKVNLRCCSCGKIYPAFGLGCAQAGHLVPGRSHVLLFNEKGVHGQCYNCNVNLKGNALDYRVYMVKTYGEEETREVEDSRFNKTFKYSVIEMEEISDKYLGMYNKLMEIEI